MSKAGEDRSSLVFRGTNGTEAEEFIADIHQVARSEGKIRDDLWIADFAVACFVGAALRWYAELEPEIQNDWRLLRRAILQKYPSSRSIERLVHLIRRLLSAKHHHSSEQDPIIPTPAAAAPPPESSLPAEGKRCWYYRVRVYFDNKASSYRLGATGNRSLFLTKRSDDGLVVFWGPDGHFAVIEQEVVTKRTIGLFWYTSPKKPAPKSLLEYDFFISFSYDTEWFNVSVAEVFLTDSKGKVDIPGYAGPLPAIRWELDNRGYLTCSCPELERNIAPSQPSTTLSQQGLVCDPTQVQFYTQPDGDERAWIRATFSEGALRYTVKSNQIFVGFTVCSFCFLVSLTRSETADNET